MQRQWRAGMRYRNFRDCACHSCRWSSTVLFRIKRFPLVSGFPSQPIVGVRNFYAKWKIQGAVWENRKEIGFGIIYISTCSRLNIDWVYIDWVLRYSIFANNRKSENSLTFLLVTISKKWASRRFIRIKLRKYERKRPLGLDRTREVG